MRLIVISGRSGSGKSTALNLLEDEGYYCVDNLPAALLPALVEQVFDNESPTYQKLAVCIDARNAWKDLSRFPELISSLPENLSVDILYLDADENSLLKRFSETRRRHPLSNANTPLAEAIESELELLEPIARASSLTMNTSDMTIYELRNVIRERLVGRTPKRMSILFQSFGFKRGVPTDADIVFDVRVLPNPHWIPDLRTKTGMETEVIDFLGSEPLVQEMLDDISQFLQNWLPRYEQNNRSYITIAIGCTGGQHRSVYVVENLRQQFSANDNHVLIRHRELNSGTSAPG
ncbi:MAG: UPF0042 nucleotide-binding protein [Halieaceae bacterium]|jgi:UPF0042 nucleotide-binding protein